MKAQIRALRLLFIAGLFFFACGKEAPKNRIVIAIPADVTTLNPLLSTSAIDHEIFRLIYPQLFRQEPDLKTMRPYFARKWQFSRNHTTCVIELRTDLHWSDGTPFTARDVEETFRWQTDPRTGYPFVEDKKYIRRLQALDDSTLAVEFSRDYPEQLQDLNEGFILPASLLAHTDPGKVRSLMQESSPVTCGPFRIKRRVMQARIILERNPEFFPDIRGDSLLQEIVFEVIPDANVRIQRLLAGEIDLIEGVLPNQLAGLANRPGIRIEHFPDRIMAFVAWNNRDPLFSSAIVRKAMAMAIDRKTILEAVYRGYARECVGPILPFFPEYDSTMATISYDPKTARQFLADEGWRDRDGDGILDRRGKPFEFELLTISNNPVRVDIAVIIQEQLKKVGVKANVQMLEFSTFIERFKQGKYQALLSAWKMGTRLDLRIFWHSRGAYNRFGYRNVMVDSLLDQLERVDSPAQKRILLHRLQRMIYDDQPVLFLYCPDRIIAMRDRFSNYRMNFLSTFFNIEEWRVQP
jgi:peptide/nickel transport system substrate-binding protein